MGWRKKKRWTGGNEAGDPKGGVGGGVRGGLGGRSVPGHGGCDRGVILSLLCLDTSEAGARSWLSVSGCVKSAPPS